MYVEHRQRLVHWLQNQLIGPAHEHNLQTSPLVRYPTGVLHPVDPNLSGIDPATSLAADLSPLETHEDEEIDDDSEEDAHVQPTRRKRYVPPSSVGFSCFIKGSPQLSITASAATYKAKERDERGKFKFPEYIREEMNDETSVWADFSAASTTRKTIWSERACIDVRARPHSDGQIITVTLCNLSELETNASPSFRARDQVKNALFEARLECVIECGDLVEYPRVELSLLTEDEQELEFQYRENRIYAIGHGAAANWDVESHKKARIWSDFMPTAEVPIMTANTGGDDSVLRMKRLASVVDHRELSNFVDKYSDWIFDNESVAGTLQNSSEIEAARRICSRMRVGLKRMRAGIELLRTDVIASESFKIANQAMLKQMIEADLISGIVVEPSTYRWRPFQLAFLLTVLPSAVSEEDEFRDILDLIWFPTGGGKTEAYLGLIAFLIAWRRQQFPECGGGTTVLMRYTLRLLTRQQFERAARIIFALELFRRQVPEKLGKTPISIGIWVGGAISPNRFDTARETVEQIRQGKPGARFRLILEHCPWCGTAFDPVEGYLASNDRFHFHCSNGDCEFGASSSPLPCNVVDEALYDQPPSLLIGTIDKFARLAWEERTGAFFGFNTPFRPPDLIIQDELHLITGPLGSVAGLYEAGVDTLLAMRGGRPKYVASTATIRMARQQVKRLYGRDLAVFPPPGLTFNDMHFARIDRNRPGRLYLGFLTPSLDQQHCLAPLAAAQLVGPQALFNDDLDRDALLDAWWTLIVYHGSLKSVGNSHNAFATDIRERGHLLIDEVRNNLKNAGIAEDYTVQKNLNGLLERIQNPRIAQLTSRATAEENAQTFQLLAVSQGDRTCLDAVLATNMVSVGLDVARLAAMIINGQPFTTAEYIQATSRVGRADVPGLVLVNYFRSQARSLSHYESFRPYHESFYRFVEPSSVTPYTFQVRSRALHAALVIAVRHACLDLWDNYSAGKFDKELPDVMAVSAELKHRCQRAAADSEQKKSISNHIDRLVDEWHEEAQRCKLERRQFIYQSPSSEKNADRLLYAHGDPRRGLWETLNSMRNVESTGSLRVRNWPPKTLQKRA